MSSAPDLTSRILRHERFVIAGGIALLVVLSWWFLASGAGMDGSSGMSPPLAALVLMWWVMMVAMMIPSAAPAILLYGRVREARASKVALAPPWMFLAGYLGVWLLFSLGAAAAQRLIAGPSMAIEDPYATSILLVVAGLYQLSPMKSACLSNCRSPAQFLTRHWRHGIGGALRLGVLHGAYCVGCCWLLMVLLFVGGVMNFLWIAGLTLIVGIEKLVPRGDWFGRAAGVALIVWGMVRLVA